jgi:hypothetical protein
MTRSHFFDDLCPVLRPDDQANEVLGIKVIEAEIQSIAIRHGIRISSAIRCEMSMTGCTYEEACVNFVRACDQIATTFHFVEVGNEAEKTTAVDEKESA